MKVRRLLSLVTLCVVPIVGCGSSPESTGGEAAQSALGAPGNGARSGVYTRVLRDLTTKVVLSLNEKTVFCTARGYGATVLKVSVPDLDWLAHFDHRVDGEGLPCMSANACVGDTPPSKMIDASHPFATAPLRVTLTETVTLDTTKETCTRALSEEIKSEVRGIDFTHSRGGDVEPADYATCVELVKVF